jgi:hypothetical protein
MTVKKSKAFETGEKSPLDFKINSVPPEKIKAHWQKILKVIAERGKKARK